LFPAYSCLQVQNNISDGFYWWTDVNCLRLQINAHVQVTFKVWRPANFLRFFFNKKA